jgi:tripeptidyl-peptidase-1
VTSAYLTQQKKAAPETAASPSSFNGAGRGYPDLAALAQFGIPLCTYGGCSGSGGTSASAPTVAGMVTLINDARLNAGRPPLGFFLPRLYELMSDPSVYAECFADVGIDKVGDMWDCPTYSTCEGCDDGSGAGNGFVATRGWDAQTGFGQPKFPGLLKHLSAD